MQGTFDFEFIGDFFHQFHALWKITIFRQIGNPSDFIPIHSQVSAHSALHSEASFALLSVGSCSAVTSASAD